jgi:hypothetical protein
MHERQSQDRQNNYNSSRFGRGLATRCPCEPFPAISYGCSRSFGGSTEKQGGTFISKKIQRIVKTQGPTSQTPLIPE